jgi:hypothetical protein
VFFWVRSYILLLWYGDDDDDDDSDVVGVAPTEETMRTFLEESDVVAAASKFEF